MTKQAQKQKTRSKPKAEVEQKSSSGSAGTQETTDLLDEIDSVLEESAAEFVEAYVQRGGE